MRNPYISKASRGNVRRSTRPAPCKVYYLARSGSFEVSRACEMTDDKRVTIRGDIAPLRPVADWSEFKRQQAEHAAALALRVRARNGSVR